MAGNKAKGGVHVVLCRVRSQIKLGSDHSDVWTVNVQGQEAPDGASPVYDFFGSKSLDEQCHGHPFDVLQVLLADNLELGLGDDRSVES